MRAWPATAVRGRRRAGRPYAAAIVVMLIASQRSDHSGRRRRFVWPFLLIAAACYYASYLISPGDFVVSFIQLIVAGPAMYAPYFALVPELPPPGQQLQRWE